jgi:IMP dehydrogenase
MSSVIDLMEAMTVSASGDESVRRAAARMEALRMEYLPVLSQDGDFVGLLTGWDLRRAHPNRLVYDALTSRLVFVPSTASIWDAYQLAEQEDTQYLVVRDDNKPIGIVSRRELEVAVARHTDALTGLPTAAYLRKRLTRLWQAETEIYLVFIDLNEFGLLNKKHGHVVGDRVLLTLSQLLSSLIDPDRDVLCRYGGDEFAIVVNRSRLEVQQLAKAITNGVEQAHASLGLSVSVAVGMAGGRRRSLHQNESSVDHLINLASRASTEAKWANGGILLVDIAAGA